MSRDGRTTYHALVVAAAEVRARRVVVVESFILWAAGVMGLRFGKEGEQKQILVMINEQYGGIMSDFPLTLWCATSSPLI